MPSRSVSMRHLGEHDGFAAIWQHPILGAPAQSTPGHRVGVSVPAHLVRALTTPRLRREGRPTGR